MYIYVMSIPKLFFRIFQNLFGGKPETSAPGAHIRSQDTFSRHVRCTWVDFLATTKWDDSYDILVCFAAYINRGKWVISLAYIILQEYLLIF